LDDLDGYQKMINEIFDRVGQAVGIHVMLIVVEHALWNIRLEYEKASAISFSEQGVSFNGLEGINSEEAAAIAHGFVMGVIDTLGRLVGKKLAHQLTLQLHREEHN